ncbi:MAG: hypothetical protein RLZZ157_1463, partial [Pseudomonadota bacterium]
ARTAQVMSLQRVKTPCLGLDLAQQQSDAIGRSPDFWVITNSPPSQHPTRHQWHFGLPLANYGCRHSHGFDLGPKAPSRTMFPFHSDLSKHQSAFVLTPRLFDVYPCCGRSCRAFAPPQAGELFRAAKLRGCLLIERPPPSASRPPPPLSQGRIKPYATPPPPPAQKAQACLSPALAP